MQAAGEVLAELEGSQLTVGVIVGLHCSTNAIIFCFVTH
jgi:hypothetical protein